ncbi:MAG: hypothetical protein AAF559_00595 [Pseudomonadota bacterium]
MNGGFLALAIAGLIGFLAGAYLASTGERMLGITFMGFGLMFQALTLRHMKMAKKSTMDQGEQE